MTGAPGEQESEEGGSRRGGREGGGVIQQVITLGLHASCTPGGIICFLQRMHGTVTVEREGASFSRCFLSLLVLNSVEEDLDAMLGSAAGHRGCARLVLNALAWLARLGLARFDPPFLSDGRAWRGLAHPGLEMRVLFGIGGGV